MPSLSGSKSLCISIHSIDVGLKFSKFNYRVPVMKYFNTKIIVISSSDEQPLLSLFHSLDYEVVP